MMQKLKKKTHILVIDDDLTFRNALCEYLTQNGFRVDSAEEGETALKMLVDDPADVVLLDIYMPKMDGLQVLTKIKKQNITAKVIILTAADGLKIAQESIKLGADDFMTKPFNLNLLVECIGKVTSPPVFSPKKT
jgi:DNA-binding response OmpR family regulator